MLFLEDTWVYIVLALCIAGPILVLMIVSTIIALVKRFKLMNKYKGVKATKVESENVNVENPYLEAYGKDNILDVKCEMSRVTVSVKDIELVNADLLKELGATGVLLVGNQVKCSFKEDASKICDEIKGALK